VLSHLFAQGATAAETLLFNETFRSDVRGALPTAFKSLVSAGSVTPGDFEVQYAIIGRPMGTKTLADVLPFFSRATLRRAAQRLKAAGFKVSVVWIPNA